MDNIIKVNDFINNELREYAIYDNERSIPSIVDGLKTSQRKVIYTVLETIKSKVPIKPSSLGAKASDLTHYKHGEASIVDTVITLAKDYSGSNNYPLLLKDGQFGNIIDNVSSSPRYIHVMRYDKLDEMFDKNDREIVKYLEFDGDSIEPIFYLPKLPLVAINGTRGIGNGYSSNIRQRSVKNVAKYIQNKLNNKEHLNKNKNLLLPHFNGFTGKVIPTFKEGQNEFETKTFDVVGVIERVNTTTTIIKDMPPCSGQYQYEKYKDRVLLPLLINSNSGVVDVINESTEEIGWRIVIKHTREFGNCTDEEMILKLKLVEKVTENLTVWDYDGKIRTFENIYDLVDYWYEERIKWYAKRKEHIISKMSVRNEWYVNLLKLINHWLHNSDKLVKLNNKELKSELAEICDNEEHVNKFLDQNISSLTKERVDKLIEDITKLKEEYDTLNAKTEHDLFLEDILDY